jgi:uncharacterized membrane protein YhaH (DUF805 family)
MNYYITVLKKYAIFKGRSGREEFWYFVLFNFIASVVVSIISSIIGDHKHILGNLYSLAVFVPSLAVSMRRLHDIGISGWFTLLYLIPIIGWIWLIVLFVKKSDPTDNKYGKSVVQVINQNTSTPPSPTQPV